jgi:tRNA A-37 threonylcarbamoyl transferase component Bud32
LSCLRAAGVSPDTIDLLLPDEKTPAQEDLIKAEPGTLIWSARLPDRTRAVVKMYRLRNRLQAWHVRARVFRARREYEALLRLSQQNVPCTEPLFWAYGETEVHGRFELLATREIEGAVPLRAWIEGASESARSAVLLSLFRHVRAMHAKGVRHGGLSFKNVLVVPAGAEAAVFLIDFSRSVLFPFDVAGTRMAWFDLADLTTKVVRRLDAAACAPLLASYGLPQEEAQRMTRFAERHKSTRGLRRRLRLEFRIRAGWIALSPRDRL